MHLYYSLYKKLKSKKTVLFVLGKCLSKTFWLECRGLKYKDVTLYSHFLTIRVFLFLSAILFNAIFSDFIKCTRQNNYHEL